MLNKQNDTGISGGLQIAECQDLAVALQGEDGTFVATTPDGGTLVIDAQEGHSIASLCYLPKFFSCATSKAASTRRGFCFL